MIADGKVEQHSSIPPFNINAETAADVYKLDDSILLLINSLHDTFCQSLVICLVSKIFAWKNRMVLHIKRKISVKLSCI